MATHHDVHPHLPHQHLPLAAHAELHPVTGAPIPSHPNASLQSLGATYPQVHLPHVSWTSLAQQFRTLVARSPYLSAGVAIAVGAATYLAYSKAMRRQQLEADRLRVLRYVKSNFTSRRDEIINFILQSEWNRFDLVTIQKVYVCFHALLTNKFRGVLPISDLAQLYKASGVTDERVALAAARYWDADGDGTINFLEFLSRLNIVVHGSRLDQLHAFFAVFDLDHTGVITKDEMEIALTALGQQTRQSQDAHAVVQEIFRRCDQDLDGKVRLSDFLQLAKVEELHFGFNRDFVAAFGLAWADPDRQIKHK